MVQRPSIHAPREFFGRFFVLAAFLTLICPTLWAQPTPPDLSKLNGKGLAELLTSMEPVENTVIHGTLIVTNKAKHVRDEIPFTGKVLRGETQWQSVFEAQATAKSPAETLIVIHTPGSTNQYLWGQSTSTNAVEPKPISAHKAAATGFAGTDYSLSDLGLEFLHWANQERLPSQARLTRPCHVLESRYDLAESIVRVVSYIDCEYASSIGSQGFPAILVAEAYSTQGKNPVKEFSLHGSSIKKVNGQYQLEQMEMSNLKTGSTTIMKFD